MAKILWNITFFKSCSSQQVELVFWPLKKKLVDARSFSKDTIFDTLLKELRSQNDSLPFKDERLV